MKRLVTALLLIPVIVYGVLWAPYWFFFACVAIVAVLCYHELCRMAKAAGPGEVVGVVAGLALLAAPVQYAFLLTTIFALVALSLSLPEADLIGAFGRATTRVLGIVYIFCSWKTALLLHQIHPNWLLFGLVINWIGDSGAYYIGRRFGRHKLAPWVSPGKSWEGTAASIVSAILFSVVVLPRIISGVTIAEAAGLALLANVAGQMGDLAESALKRGCGVKDSGDLLPGHGGMLDRVDSAIFSLPLLYCILTIVR